MLSKSSFKPARMIGLDANVLVRYIT